MVWSQSHFLVYSTLRLSFEEIIGNTTFSWIIFGFYFSAFLTYLTTDGALFIAFTFLAIIPV